MMYACLACVIRCVRAAVQENTNQGGVPSVTFLGSTYVSTLTLLVQANVYVAPSITLPLGSLYVSPQLTTSNSMLFQLSTLTTVPPSTPAGLPVVQIGNFQMDDAWETANGGPGLSIVG